MYSSPISNFREIFQKSEKILKDTLVKYHRPEIVKEKEDLNQKNLEELSEGITSHYNIQPIEIKRIERTGKKDGIFYIKDNKGRKYILKHYGRDLRKLDALATITNYAPEIFPRIIPTRRGSNSWEMEDGHYTLEDFVCGEHHIRDKEYFLGVGESMAKMHERLNGLLKENRNIKKTLYSKERSISESNLASLWIDMTLGNYLSSREEVEELTKVNLRERISRSPESFIHADLNNANIIWTPNGLKFIDVETIRFSKRILDFEGPLLFQGNMMPPEYIPDSFALLTEGYNNVASEPLQREELSVVKDLMTYVLLKNFVIRNIRRGDERNSLNRLEENISKIRKEKLV